MNVDLEAGGALATAGLAAKAVEGSSGTAGEGHGGLCANCKAQLVGSYCHACGQSAHVHRSIWHMMEEGLHGVLHFDSKMWRTLPLLAGRPGVLTRRYIDGQRVRYVSPLALFLFTIFLMFFVLSFASGGKVTSKSEIGDRNTARAELVAEVAAAKANVTERTEQLAKAMDPDEREDATEELTDAQTELRQAEVILSAFDKAAASGADPTKMTEFSSEELSALTGLDLGEGAVSVGGVLKNIAQNPELMLYKFKNTAYKFSFMLIPISLPFLWLMFFWKRDVTTYDHMVFSMYSLSFMSLLFVVIALMASAQFTSRFIPFMLWLPPLHMFVHLKETYRLKFFSALWRTFALLVSAGTVFVLFMVLVATITAM